MTHAVIANAGMAGYAGPPRIGTARTSSTGARSLIQHVPQDATASGIALPVIENASMSMYAGMRSLTHLAPGGTGRPEQMHAAGGTWGTARQHLHQFQQPHGGVLLFGRLFS